MLDGWSIKKPSYIEKPPKPPVTRKVVQAMSKTAGEISIKLNTESGKAQRQLRAIAKHTEALADELDEIDQAQCPECESSNTVIEATTLSGDDGSIYELHKEIKCLDCSAQSVLSKG